MVATYSIVGDSFRPGKPGSWSDVQILDFGLGNFALHPDGKRVAVFKDPASATPSRATKVSFIFNFPEEIRRKFAASQR